MKSFTFEIEIINCTFEKLTSDVSPISYSSFMTQSELYLSNRFVALLPSFDISLLEKKRSAFLPASDYLLLSKKIKRLIII